MAQSPTPTRATTGHQCPPFEVSKTGEHAKPFSTSVIDFVGEWTLCRIRLVSIQLRRATDSLDLSSSAALCGFRHLLTAISIAIQLFNTRSS